MGQKRVKGFGVGCASVRIRRLVSIDPAVWSLAQSAAKESGRSVSRFIEDLLKGAVSFAVEDIEEAVEEQAIEPEAVAEVPPGVELIGAILNEPIALTKAWCASVDLALNPVEDFYWFEGSQWEALPVIGWKDPSSPTVEFSKLPMTSLLSDEQVKDFCKKYPLSMRNPAAMRNAMGQSFGFLVADALEKMDHKWGYTVTSRLADEDQDRMLRYSQAIAWNFGMWLRFGNFPIAIGQRLAESERELRKIPKPTKPKTGFGKAS